MSVTVTNDGTSISVDTPYDPEFPARARAIGGRWNKSREVWTFDARDDARVRELVRDVYGTDGSDDDAPTVTVRVPADGIRMYRMQSWHVAGIRLAYRPARDASAILGRGVVVVEGGFPSWGGSRANPDLNPEVGTVLEVRDVSQGTAAKIMAEVAGASIMEAIDEQRAALEAERAKLAARIAEIDALLSQAPA